MKRLVQYEIHQQQAGGNEEEPALEDVVVKVEEGVDEQAVESEPLPQEQNIAIENGPFTSQFDEIQNRIFAESVKSPRRSNLRLPLSPLGDINQLVNTNEVSERFRASLSAKKDVSTSKLDDIEEEIKNTKRRLVQIASHGMGWLDGDI